jgi:hypothetical protein
MLKAFSLLIGLTALAGFLLGSERTARWFGILWQTETPTRREYWIAVFIVVSLVGTMFVFVLRALGIS